MSQLIKEEKLQESVTEQSSGLLRFTLVFEKITVSINNVLHKISSVVLLVLMFLTTADVAGRYFFNAPIIGTYELTGLYLLL